MRFDLVRPCANCPFRTDCAPGWLGAPKAASIVDSLTEQDAGFPCHKTVRHTFDGVRIPDAEREQNCAGALLVLERDPRHGGLWANLSLRLGAMLRFFDPARLDRSAPVFKSFSHFIKHHSK